MSYGNGMEQMPLAGLTEIAQRAGVQKPVVSMWRKRYDTFPQPVAQLHTGAVFWWPQVAAWLKATGRKTDANWDLSQTTPNWNKDYYAGLTRKAEG